MDESSTFLIKHNLKKVNKQMSNNGFLKKISALRKPSLIHRNTILNNLEKVAF